MTNGRLFENKSKMTIGRLFENRSKMTNGRLFENRSEMTNGRLFEDKSKKPKILMMPVPRLCKESASHHSPQMPAAST